MPSRPAKSTRTGCYRRARSLVMGTMIKMMLLLVAMSGSALPRATTEALPIPVNYDHHASSGHDHDSSGHDHHPETTRHGGHRERGELWHMAVDEAGQRCTTNPLLERKVDPNKYELGCAEIEKLLAGPSEFLGHGVVRNVSMVEYNGKPLVVKKLIHQEKESHQEKHLEMHRREVLALDALAGHRNVANMLGYCNTTIVTEYHDSFLGIMFREGQPLPIAQIVSMALDAARGLQGLHEMTGCLHVDLKPEQLLIDEEGRIMLNDFNRVHVMSVSPTDGSFCPVESARRSRHTPWPSPENYMGEHLTEKADVYSMGMIFFAMIAGRLPYYGDPAALDASFARKGRPAIDPIWHEGFMEVVQAMWAENPKERPYMGGVVAMLEAIWAELGLPPKAPPMQAP